MAQKLADLIERGASAQQVGGQGMTQQMRAFEIRGYSGALQSATNDTADVDGWPDPRLAGARRLTVCGDVGLIEVRYVRGCLKSMA
jgi:hypothetical protein